MKTAGKFSIVLAGLTLSLAGVVTSCAQGSYNQPDYSQQQGYNQPNQQPYDQQGPNQPGYGQPLNGQPDFYADLAPHGQWVNTPEYGRVWIPNAGPDFQPYASNGHWVVTEYGNTWVSDYAWGWAPFHYGRWFQDRYRGWAWVPGNEWGPAWVSWRSGGGYYGWAPLGPGLNININVNIPASYWTFVPQVYITSPRLYSYCVPRPRVVNIYQNTTIINNVYRVNNRAYAYGPRRDEIERVTRQSVPVYRIENTGRPGRDVVGNGSVGIYRPNADRSSRGGESRVYNAPFDNNRRGNARTDAPAPVNTTPNPGAYTGRTSRGNAGTYNGGSPATTPAEATPSYPQRGQSSRGGSYGRPSYEAQQNVPAPQTGQTYQQPSRPDVPAQGQWNRGNRPESAPQRDGGRVGNSQPQTGGAEQRTQSQAQPQGGYSSGRGSSRGPR